MSAGSDLCLIILCSTNAARVDDLLTSVVMDPDRNLEVHIVLDRRAGRRAVELSLDHARRDSRIHVRRITGGMSGAIAAIAASTSAPYIAFIEPNSVWLPGGHRGLAEMLGRSGSSFAIGVGESLMHPGRRVVRALDGAADSERTGVRLEDLPGLIGDDLLANKLFRRDFIQSQVADGPQWFAETFLASCFVNASGIDITTRSVFWHGGHTDNGRVRLGSTEWATAIAAACAVLRATNDDVRERHARAVLTRDLLAPQALESFNRDGLEPGISELVVRLAGVVEESALANMPITGRWSLALLAMNQPDALRAVRNGDRDFSKVDTGSFKGSMLEGDAWLSLGLGDLDVREGFIERFVKSVGSPEASALLIDVNEHPIDISVVIPTHNVAPYVDELLNSIRAAVGVRLEIIVVDDASTDGTWERVRAHEGADPRVRALRSPGAGGGQARNAGVSLARGEYIAFADGDDLVPPRAYARMLEAARRTSADVVCGNYVKFFAKTTWNARRSFNEAYTVAVEGVTVDHHPQLTRHRAVWSRLIRRKHWLASALPFPGVPRSNDIVPMLAVLLAARSIAVVPLPVYVYRDRPGDGSMTSAAGSANYTLSYFSEEVKCAMLIAQRGSMAAAREYWDMVLTSDGWGNIVKFLAQARKSDGADAVGHQVSALVDAIPPEVFAALPAPYQAVWLLTAGGWMAEAHSVAAALERGSKVSAADIASALVRLAELPRMPKESIARLVTQLALPRLRVGRWEDGPAPIRALRELVTDHDLRLAVIPWSREAEACGRLFAADASTALSTAEPIDAHLRSGINTVRLVLDEPIVSDGPYRLVARPYGKHAEDWITIARGGSARIGSHVGVSIGVVMLPRVGAWSLEFEYTTDGQTRRRPVILREQMRRLIPGRLRAGYVVHPGSARSGLRVRGALVDRVTGRLRSHRRRAR